MRRIPPVPVALGVLGALVLTGCGATASSHSPASSASPASASSASGGPAPAGTVRVLYAGSLVNLMKDVGPAFDQADGGSLQGESAGSDALVNEIKGKVKQADVFISASTSANSGLMGGKNGDWESWYASFASAPLVIAYNPKSKFANDLKTKPWAEVVKEPGFTLGSTDPKLDPKGKLAAKALRIEKISTDKIKVFPEEQLLARLASGNLDAGFFYSSEAKDDKLPTVSLGGIHLAATYTVSVLNRAPNASGGQAFVKYLLSAPGKALVTRHGLTLQSVTVAGTTSAIPGDLRPELGHLT